MTSKERVLAALNHKEPDHIPIDFGSTAVTGIHASCVAGLREHYGLETRPVKVHEPYQVLGLVEDDLKEAMGIDVEGVFPRKTLFGFENKGWKPWRLQDGLDVEVPEDFRTTDQEERRRMYAEKKAARQEAERRGPSDRAERKAAVEAWRQRNKRRKVR